MAKYRVSHPDPQFSGEIVGVVFADGAATVDTEAEGGHAAYAYFQRASYPTAPYEEPPAEAETPVSDGAPAEADPFDPAGHNADDVLAHLAAADDEERARVLAAEAAADKPRKSVLAFQAPTQGDQS